MPCLRHAGTCSTSTTEFRTPVSYTVTISPPYLKCSAVMSSGPVDFFNFMILTAWWTSSVVKGTSRKTSSFWKDSDKQICQLFHQSLQSMVCFNL